MTMEAKHFKVGDKVRLTGKDWDDRIGLERTVKNVLDAGDRVSLTPNGRNTNYVYNDPEGDYSAVLIERDGKRVKAIAERRDGQLVVTYTNDFSERWSIGHQDWKTDFLMYDASGMVKADPYAWTLIFSEPTAMPVDLDARLAKIKADHVFCSEFNVQVARAKKIIADGDLKAVLGLIAKEQGYPDLIKELDAPEKTVKWPKGTTVQDKSRPNVLLTVNKDVYEGDGTFYGDAWYFAVGGFQRVEIKVVD